MKKDEWSHRQQKQYFRYHTPVSFPALTDLVEPICTWAPLLENMPICPTGWEWKSVANKHTAKEKISTDPNNLVIHITKLKVPWHRQEVLFQWQFKKISRVKRKISWWIAPGVLNELIYTKTHHSNHIYQMYSVRHSKLKTNIARLKASLSS